MKSPPISRLIDIFVFYRLSFKKPETASDILI